MRIFFAKTNRYKSLKKTLLILCKINAGIYQQAPDQGIRPDRILIDTGSETFLSCVLYILFKA